MMIISFPCENRIKAFLFHVKIEQSLINIKYTKMAANSFAASSTVVGLGTSHLHRSLSKSTNLTSEPEVHPVQSRYLDLHELFIDDIIWVDEAVSLQKATSYIKGCKVDGVDCEWKPNYVKGSRANKVSIMQIASEKVAFPHCFTC
ncbi:uncharacterized protein LOC125499636 [Beta vulgaris subsp. vulgaris]|uniref:uncharacterized protein LOC125499636 n=1 Tax=Beta vulgaris subsp. vulgaris TaxID=3555 RepID=UPI00254709F2|nr:uncharacterized protein LOC125499636 [Beta vulgaris subsp. vulgaris]